MLQAPEKAADAVDSPLCTCICSSLIKRDPDRKRSKKKHRHALTAAASPKEGTAQ
jgi:hypothetical protein